MPIIFDRNVCCDLNETIKREWLVTNGLGGYAAGTVAGVLTRLQHGLLVVAPPEVSTPQLLLAKIDEEVLFDERTYYLGTNEYRDGTLNPAGFVHLETFRLEEGFPVFTYHLGGLKGIMLEKRIWMPYGQNTTCIQYRVLRTANDEGFVYKKVGLQPTYGSLRYQEFAHNAPHALTLTLLPFATHRPHTTALQHDEQRQFSIQVRCAEDFIDADAMGTKAAITGCTLHMQDEATETFPYHILALAHQDSHATFLPAGIWYWNFLRRHEASAGSPATDDLYLPGVLRATLWPGEDAALTLIVTTEKLPSHYRSLEKLRRSYPQNVERQRRIFSHALEPERYFGEGGEAVHAQQLRVLPLLTTPDPVTGGEEYLRQLLQAANRFLIRPHYPRPEHIDNQPFLMGQTERISLLLSNYYQMTPTTRDMLIALPGLLLVTGRNDDAQTVLRTLFRLFRGGLLPDRFPPSDHRLSDDDYSNADAGLWFFYALDAYLRASRNWSLLEEFYHRLADCIECYTRGTSNGIYLDPDDGLLIASQPGKALTWMNALVDGIPVTPRAGKPVEINALWYHALSLMHEWSQRIGQHGQLRHNAFFYKHGRLLERCRASFEQRFWHTNGGYLYDVVDGPSGNDASIRPNQLFAFAFRYPVLNPSFHQRILDVVTEHLLTPYGLRTLSPHDQAYRSRLEQTPDEHARTLHQGSTWIWLLEPYITTLLTTHRNSVSHNSSQNDPLCQEYLWRKGLQMLEPTKELFSQGLLGMNAGIFDGDSPHRPSRHSHFQASATGTAALLRCYEMLSHIRTAYPEYALTY
ncbi:glycogen debranching protein [Reticulibacter mediterranei]|uniref:Glycogen debranching protein n=1 Tax=Reticulibacter mediterranei TaxID=2778369 RepID=A0A8J3N2R5_9CHLR|nr:amylo-alpha-1,6-glucosidase [Reticulibacter mediterranei]GHO93475.1 glycogen debranching protein [Reticulibacter mediterranei]